MKLIFSLLLLLLIGQECFSQLPYTKSYDVKNYRNGMAVSPDGSVVVGGSNYQGISFIMRVNTSGDVLFAREFSDPFFNQVLALADGSSLIGMTQYPDTCKIMKADSNGNILWSKGYYGNGVNLYIDKMFSTGHNTFLIAGGGACFEIDVTGNLLWSRQFDGGGNFISISETSSGYLFSRWDYDSEVYNFGIIKTDFTGAITWVNNQYLHIGYNYTVFHAAVAETGGAIYACMSVDYKYSNQPAEGVGGILQKFDLEGNRISSKSFSVTDGIIQTVFDCRYLDNGKFAVSLLRDHVFPTPSDNCILEIDTAGVIHWAGVYADSLISQLDADSDHNLYGLVGKKFYLLNEDIPLLLSKITSNGESACAVKEVTVVIQDNLFLFPVSDPPWLPDTLQLSIKEVQINLQPLSVAVIDVCLNSGIADGGTTETPAIFPNPADNFIELTIPESFKMVKYEVFNPSGTMIFQSKTLSHGASGVHHIDLQSYEEGLYALRITCDNRVFTEKFVVAH